MQLGFALPTSGSWATPGNQLDIARRAEELGYASLWTFQRLLYPAEPDSPRWTETYRSVHDPLVVLSFVAGHTTDVRLGLAVVNMPWYSPVVLAKALTSLDHVCAGRLDAGLGLGWAREEYVATGAPYEQRGARGEEFVRCLKAIWTEDVVDFSGTFYQVPAARIEPKPVQRPHPPILLGGSADVALRRAGRIADGWVSGSAEALTDIGARIDVVRRAARDAGRDADALRFVCRGVVRLRPAGHQDRRPLRGSVEEIRADLELIRDQGVTELFVDLNFDREIGSPDADPAASMARANELLEALSPSGG